MVSDTSSRITGVRQFLDKWASTFESWYGVEGGNRFRERYFARVIARLVVSNLIGGDFRGALRALRSIFQFSEQWGYNSSVVLKILLAELVDRKLPPPVPELMRKIKRKMLVEE
jgi:hypothetical protein